ncbi:MAG: hypothetical protein ACRD0P_24310, partial [Stackebrandtia sp.]
MAANDKLTPESNEHGQEYDMVMSPTAPAGHRSRVLADKGTPETELVSQLRDLLDSLDTPQ